MLKYCLILSTGKGGVSSIIQARAAEYQKAVEESATTTAKPAHPSASVRFEIFHCIFKHSPLLSFVSSYLLLTRYIASESNKEEWQGVIPTNAKPAYRV